MINLELFRRYTEANTKNGDKSDTTRAVNTLTDAGSPC